MAPRFQDIVEELPRYREVAASMREVLLANLVLIGEIPAPTFEEGARISFLQNRFSECGLHNTSTDEAGNGFGILPGEEGGAAIAVLAHADTPYPADVDHTISVQPDRVLGAGVADNSLGLAVLTSLPTLLERLEVKLRCDLMLMGTVNSLGRGNLRGLSFFLENSPVSPKAAICVEGIQLGRLSIGSIGMLRATIKCSMPEEYDWTRFGAAGAIQTINEVINKMTAIELPKKPRSSIVMGAIKAGNSFNTVAKQGELQFEIRSESADIVKRIADQIKDIVDEVSSETESNVTLDVVAHREPGGIPFAHPLSKRTRAIMQALDVEHRMLPSTSELSAFIEKAIPAVTVGITTGEKVSETRELVRIEPMATGLAQLLGMILAIDGGFCDERK